MFIARHPAPRMADRLSRSSGRLRALAFLATRPKTPQPAPYGTRRGIRRMHGGAKLAKDIYLNEQEIVSRMSSDGETWTSETSTPFLNNADRVMRFDRKAFLGMIKIAEEINFATSPVCFRHEHRRGMLIEQTLGTDLPDFEEVA